MEKPPHNDEVLQMYLDEKTARNFAKLEENPEHEKVSAVIDRLISREMQDTGDPLAIAELGGGAHPDRYHALFQRLLQSTPNGHIDWVDASGHMLKYGEEILESPAYQERKKAVRFVEEDILTYLKNAKDDSLDGSIMKYTINYIPPEDLEPLFELLSQKLKRNGRLIATLSSMSGELISIAPVARFLYEGKEFPADEKRKLKEGEAYGIKFFKTPSHPEEGYLEGAQTKVFYHSPERLTELAKRYGFEYYIGSWKKLLSSDPESIDQNVVILRNNKPQFILQKTHETIQKLIP